MNHPEENPTRREPNPNPGQPHSSKKIVTNLPDMAEVPVGEPIESPLHLLALIEHIAADGAQPDVPTERPTRMRNLNVLETAKAMKEFFGGKEEEYKKFIESDVPGITLKQLYDMALTVQRQRKTGIPTPQINTPEYMERNARTIKYENVLRWCAQTDEGIMADLALVETWNRFQLPKYPAEEQPYRVITRTKVAEARALSRAQNPPPGQPEQPPVESSSPQPSTAKSELIVKAVRIIRLSVGDTTPGVDTIQFVNHILEAFNISPQDLEETDIPKNLIKVIKWASAKE